MPEGTQSPPPETQRPEQVTVPSGGHGADTMSREKQRMIDPRDQLKVS
jgi:hypothetical protein